MPKTQGKMCGEFSPATGFSRAFAAFFPATGMLVLSFSIIGCEPPEILRPAEPALVDTALVRSAIWDDGQAEVSFYMVERNRNQYGEFEDQQFLAGSYLVKHDYDRRRESKAAGTDGDAVEAFKYALFYEFESGSYDYKRHWVVNAARNDLAPLKASFTSFDWCSNRYREFSFRNGGVRYLMRSDDYGNHDENFEIRRKTVPPAQVPLLVRFLDFSEQDTLLFHVIQFDGELTPVTAHATAPTQRSFNGEERTAFAVSVHYGKPVPSPFGENSDISETYWIGEDEERLLLAMEAESGRYSIELIETLRSAYWEENLYERLARVTGRP